MQAQNGMARRHPHFTRDSHLDLLRATAITMVVAYHVVQMSPVPLPGLMRIATAGQYGVDLFFVLSGWLIGGLFWRERAQHGTVQLWRFWTRRWLRTIPPYLVALLLAWLAVSVERRQPFDWGYLVFVQNYYARIPFFLVSWSLCIEEHFYLFLPLLLVVGARGRRSIPLVFTTLILVAPLCRWFLALHGVDPEFGYAKTATHLRMEGLLMGFWAAYLLSFQPLLWSAIRKLSPWAMATSASALCALRFLPEARMYQIGLTTLALGLCSLLVFSVGKAPSLVSASRAVKWIAVSSYSVYLTHALMIHLARRIIMTRSGLQWWLYFPLVIGLIGAAGAAFYFAVERVSIQLRDRWVPPRKQAPPRIEGNPC